MLRYRLVQFLLLPISLLYGLSILLRNALYKVGLLKRVEFNIPVISIGNLSVGGTGKSPHIEYLIRLLKDHIYVGTLSRGYSRKTKGFRWVQTDSSSLDVGDEPLQFKTKFPDIAVAVGENRVLSVVQMLKDYTALETILLDDAYQHLPIKPGLNILLTEYSRPYYKDFLLPSGRLREWPSARQRADLVIVSKCPQELSDSEISTTKKGLDLAEDVPVFFTRYAYRDPYFIFDKSISVALDENTDILLVSAIANVDYLLEYLRNKSKDLKTMEFEDHHYFNNFEMGQIERSFSAMDSNHKIIVTTEKDATRLRLHHSFIVEKQLPIFVLPAEVVFLNAGAESFETEIKNFLLTFES